MLSSGCQAHRIEAWGERKTRGVSRSLEQGKDEGDGLCVDSMRPPLRIGYHLDALYMRIGARRIGDSS